VQNIYFVESEHRHTDDSSVYIGVHLCSIFTDFL